MISRTWHPILLCYHINSFCHSTVDDITGVGLLVEFELLLETLQEKSAVMNRPTLHVLRLQKESRLFLHITKKGPFLSVSQLNLKHVHLNNEMK